MKQIPVKDLHICMVTALDVLNYDKKVIVPKGVILTENIITRLDGYSVYYICVNDQIINGFTHSLINAGNGKTSKDSQFTRNFGRCCELFQESVMGTLYRNEPFQAKELLKSLIALVHSENNDMSVLHSLLNMQSADETFYSHCTTVAVISYLLAGWLHFSDDDKMTAASCGIFHDIGKILLPPAIFRKSHDLTEREIEAAKTHTTEGFHLLCRNRDVPEPIENAALMHHERCDGSGYPYGLKSAEIDKFSKIVAIADTFDNITSARYLASCTDPLSIVKFFEDDGIQKYEQEYLLTFLKNVLSSYSSEDISLSSGMENNVIFINYNSGEKEEFDIQENYYRSIMQLSSKKNVSIETII